MATNFNWETGIDVFVDALASDSATPGGGAAAAAMAAMGCGLCMMALGVSAKLPGVTPENKKTITAHLDALYLLKERLKGAIALDAEAYEAVVSARRLPKGADRASALQEALKTAALAPADAARAAIEVLNRIEGARAVVSPVIISDVVCGVTLLNTSVACFIENIKVNLLYIKDEDFVKKLQENINYFSKFC